MKKNSKRRSSRSNHRGALCALFGGFISIGFLLFSQQLVAVEIASFHDRVLATYNFAPHSVTKEEISAKSKTLDTFWTEVKANQATDLPALREELARPDAPTFFEYDGAKLLLSLSNLRSDESIALSAINHADLADLQFTDYFLTVHAMSVDGLDTMTAALKILEDDKFQAYIPQHALTLDQEMCLAYLLLPTDERFYLGAIEQRLFQEKSVVAQKSLLSVLGDTATKQGDAAIARFAADASQPEEARAYARTIVEATKKMTDLPLVGVSTKSYEALKTEQRKLFARVSDEALSDWYHLRLKIRHKGAK
jgi:plasmid stabilization system protein ParE